MRTHRWDLGPGTVYVLEAPAESASLKPALRKLISPRALELFGGFPASFEALAARTSNATWAAWLREAATSRASIAVYDLRPGAGMPSKAWLELDFRRRDTDRVPWRVLVDGQTGAPPHCPSALAEIYEAIGGVATQYGASGTLIPPDEVRPLSEMGGEVDHLFDSAHGAALTRAEGREWYAYYETSGDYLCYRRDGLSRWFGFESVSADALKPTEHFVEEFLSTLLARTWLQG